MTGAVHGDFDLSLVWSRRGGLACVVFCTLFASCLSLTLSLPRMYRATATLLVAQAGGVEGSGRLTVTGDLETGLHTITEEILSQPRLVAPRGVGEVSRPGSPGPPKGGGGAVPGGEKEPAEPSRRAEFRVLDPAMPPWTAAPDRLRLVLLGVLAAVGATAAAVLLAERLDTSFYSCDELRAFTRVPVLAAIPQIVTTADAASPRRWFTAVAVAGGL